MEHGKPQARNTLKSNVMELLPGHEAMSETKKQLLLVNVTPLVEELTGFTSS